MTGTIAIEAAISTLANSMRLYGEAQMRFADVFGVDREEAINNVDRAFEAKLEAFHTLYDVSKAIFPYFDHGDTALLIAVRNAIHHRNHPLFRGLYARLLLDEDPERWRGAALLLSTYPTLHGAPILMQNFVRLDDVDARLNPDVASPHLNTSMKAPKVRQTFELIDRELALGAIRAEAARERYPDDQVYLDLMPVFTSAVVRVFKAMKAIGIRFRGFDADAYSVPFTNEIEVDLGRPIFKAFRVAADPAGAWAGPPAVGRGIVGPIVDV